MGKTQSVLTCWRRPATTFPEHRSNEAPCHEHLTEVRVPDPQRGIDEARSRHTHRPTPRALDGAHSPRCSLPGT